MALPSLTTTINPFPSGRDKTQKWQIYKGKVAVGSGGLYATNGLPFALTGAAVLTSTPIDWMEMYSLTTGFIYKWDPVHQTIRVYEGASGSGTISAPALTMDSYTPAGSVAAPTFTGTAHTPTGTVSAPTITTTTGTPATLPVGVDGTGNLTQTTGATGIKGVQAPTFTGDSATPAGSNSAPAFTGTAHVLTGTVAAPTFTGDPGGNLVELTNGASVTADTLYFRAECVSN